MKKKAPTMKGSQITYLLILEGFPHRYDLVLPSPLNLLPAQEISDGPSKYEVGRPWNSYCVCLGS